VKGVGFSAQGRDVLHRLRLHMGVDAASDNTCKERERARETERERAREERSPTENSLPGAAAAAELFPTYTSTPYPALPSTRVLQIPQLRPRGSCSCSCSGVGSRV